MKCPDCGEKMKLTEKVEAEGKPTYKSYICNDMECFNIVETIDGKIIGEEAEVMFVPGRGFNEQ